MFDRRVEPNRVVWSLTSSAALTSVGTGMFAEPANYVSLRPASFLDPQATLRGYSFTQFAYPVIGGAGRPFELNPAPNLSSPPAVIPMLIDSEVQVTLLAPLGAWHEQIIAVRQNEMGIDELRWGWHGDLDEVPAGFSAELGIYSGRTASDVLSRWAADIKAAAGTTRRPTSDNPATSHLSYWTDNGAAYWYRREPDLDLAGTLAQKLKELSSIGVEIGAVEFDSWFYEHEVSRGISEVGYLDEVPPTGMLEWTARSDVLPDGVDGLARQLGSPPLILHARHISAASPYLDDGDWWVDVGAHPVDQSFFARWFADAKRWGAVCVEQDWMLLSWFGVRQLRAAPGRALAWQKALDTAAGAHDMGLMWCMPTPADLVATVELNNLIAIRTSDDYRFAADPALLWHWYLMGNRLIGELDLTASKDCFFTSSDTGSTEIDGDQHAEAESVLAALSAGVVGIGDRIGRTDASLVDRLCRPDGVLVKPDRPVAIADQCFFADPLAGDQLLWGETAVGDWRYIVALHTASTEGGLGDEFDLGGEYLVYEWRTGTAVVADQIRVELGHRDWALFVCCPITTAADGDRHALIGDPSKYVTMGPTRMKPSGEPVVCEADVSVTVRRWTEADGIRDTSVA